MDRRLQPQWEVSGMVEAPVESVWQALLTGYPVLTAADKDAISRWNRTEPYRVTHGNAHEGSMHIEVDIRQHSIALQGNWWYRGVQSVAPRGQHSRVTYSVYNIAPGIGWWAAQLVQGRQNARTMHQQHEATLNAIGQHLHCAAYLLHGQAAHS